MSAQLTLDALYRRADGPARPCGCGRDAHGSLTLCHEGRRLLEEAYETAYRMVVVETTAATIDAAARASAAYDAHVGEGER